MLRAHGDGRPAAGPPARYTTPTSSGTCGGLHQRARRAGEGGAHEGDAERLDAEVESERDALAALPRHRARSAELAVLRDAPAALGDSRASKRQGQLVPARRCPVLDRDALGRSQPRGNGEAIAEGRRAIRASCTPSRPARKSGGRDTVWIVELSPVHHAVGRWKFHGSIPSRQDERTKARSSEAREDEEPLADTRSSRCPRRR